MPSLTSSVLRSAINISAAALVLFFSWNLPLQAAYDFQSDSGLKRFADKIGYNAGETDINQKLSTGLNILFSFLGVIFLALIVYGGVLWMTDQGNAKHKEKAKEVITEAVAGLIIIIAAYAITRFVFTYLRGGDLTGNANNVIDQSQGVTGNDFKTEDDYINGGY